MLISPLKSILSKSRSRLPTNRHVAQVGVVSIVTTTPRAEPQAAIRRPEVVFQQRRLAQSHFAVRPSRNRQESTMAPPNHRRRFFIDRPIQGALLLRALVYCVATVVTQVVLVIFVAVIFSSPDDFYANARQFGYFLRLSLLASAIVLPLILFDLVRLSHRWVGPIFRLRTALQALSRGETVAPIRFREGDYWQELAGDFNTIAAELNRRRESAPEDAKA